jgi:hypothetical protein
MQNRFSIYDCVVRELPKIHNRAGNITPMSAIVHLPFNIERIYYLYDIPGGSIRGGHAHRCMQQLIVAASGSFDVLIDDGTNRKVVNLNRPYIGLYITPGIWRELLNFSSGAICLVLASTKFDESDYIREYSQFKDIYHGI